MRAVSMTISMRRDVLLCVNQNPIEALEQPGVLNASNVTVTYTKLAQLGLKAVALAGVAAGVKQTWACNLAGAAALVRGGGWGWGWKPTHAWTWRLGRLGSALTEATLVTEDTIAEAAHEKRNVTTDNSLC
jgi:hypothetical protein